MRYRYEAEMATMVEDWKRSVDLLYRRVTALLGCILDTLVQAWDSGPIVPPMERGGE